MSREIKFRAWDKTYNFMSYKVLVGNTDSKDENYTAHCMWIEPENVDYDREPGWMHFDEHSDVILMQYTGLKDKNGKEIYEGDILEIKLGTGSPLRCSIEYKAPSFCRKWIDKVSRKRRPSEIEPMAWNTHIIYEVIGNIYENPELLEATA